MDKKTIQKTKNGEEHKDDIIEMNQLAVILKQEKWTNRKLSKKIGYDETTISLWAQNRRQPPIAALLRIAILLNRNLQDFLINSKDGLTVEQKNEYAKKLELLSLKSKKTGKTKKKE